MDESPDVESNALSSDSEQQWVDTHCHLQLDRRPSTELLGRATSVEWLVAPGVDLESSRAAIDLAAEYPDRVRAAAGLHPHVAERWPQEGEAIAEAAIQAVAVGETGLDFYRNLSSRSHQLESFRSQIALAIDLGKPLVVHCRDAFADVYRLLEDSSAGPSAVMHCWTGGPRWTRRFLDLGVQFSFAGPVAFPNGDTVRRGAAIVPPSRAMVETDTPYLTPPPHRGKPNEPAWVALVGAALARVWAMEPREVASVTSNNARRAFSPDGGLS
jgi:TatD DNase family protein